MTEPVDRGGQLPMLRESPVWPRHAIEDIQTKSQLGRYRIQGFSMHRKVPRFDDLSFVPCTLSRVPLEGYREKCSTESLAGILLSEGPSWWCGCR